MVEERGEHAGSIGIKTLTAASKPQLTAAAQANIAPGQLVHTDGWSGYDALSEPGHTHHAEKIPPSQAHEKLPRVHIAIAHARRFLPGTYHGVSPKSLRAYLDESSYRFNGRAREPTLTSRLIAACVSANPVTLAELKA